MIGTEEPEPPPVGKGEQRPLTVGEKWMLHRVELSKVDATIDIPESEKHPLLARYLGTTNKYKHGHTCFGSGIYHPWQKEHNVDAVCHCCKVHISESSLMAFMLKSTDPSGQAVYRFVKQEDAALQQALKNPVTNLAARMDEVTVPMRFY